MCFPLAGISTRFTTRRVGFLADKKQKMRRSMVKMLWWLIRRSETGAMGGGMRWSFRFPMHGKPVSILIPVASSCRISWIALRCTTLLTPLTSGSSLIIHRSSSGGVMQKKSWVTSVQWGMYRSFTLTRAVSHSAWNAWHRKQGGQQQRMIRLSRFQCITDQAEWWCHFHSKSWWGTSIHTWSVAGASQSASGRRAAACQTRTWRLMGDREKIRRSKRSRLPQMCSTSEWPTRSLPTESTATAW